jgi:Family of unknown function (DUF6328)
MTGPTLFFVNLAHTPNGNGHGGEGAPGHFEGTQRRTLGSKICRRVSIREMSSELDRKVKTALNETRLLILGVQVLLGFQFQAFFQDGFFELSQVSRYLSLAGLVFVILALVFLVIPSMEHRLLERGHSSTRLIGATSFYTGLGLAPLASSPSLSAYIVLGRHFGIVAGVIGGLGLGALSAIAWFGFECLIGLAPEKQSMETTQTPLATKMEQLLTEARVIIPGAQALFGFQFVAMLTTGFDRLPQASKVMHALALGLIAINIVLLMMPAALHRLSYGGDESGEFLRIGSALVIAAPVFLAGGIATESYVVLQKVINEAGWSAAGACATFLVIALCWYALPVLLRASRKGRSVGGRKLKATTSR